MPPVWDEAARFRAAAADLAGKRCWGVAAGEGTGARLGLDMGGKVKRDRPLDNPLVSEDVRCYEAAYSLFVEGCPWRVQSAAAVVGGWLDDNANDGPMVATLERLVGARVEPPAWDLRLGFDHGLALVVFPDATAGAEWDDNDRLFTPAEIFVVGQAGALRSEPRLLSGPVLDGA
ncbi:MAG: hypothetical protein QOF01_4035 [Thermomicrobiales bacterium]|jgi:hypothetical protein|nr:hypothetical protein [Thermomicrobiales bacterium]